MHPASFRRRYFDRDKGSHDQNGDMVLLTKNLLIKVHLCDGHAPSLVVVSAGLVLFEESPF